MPDTVELKIKQIIPRTPNVKSFRLAASGTLNFQAGQFALVSLKTEPQLQRYLSISSSPTESGYIEFTKKFTQSDFSAALASLKAGDTVRIQYPFGKFTLDEPQAKAAFLSGGIGITPLRSICRYAIDTDLGVDIVLLYANRSIEDIAFRDDFAAMQQQYPKLKVVHVLSNPPAGFTGRPGRINGPMIKEEIPDYARRKFYICGPPAMVTAMKKIAVDELCLPEGGIITENFMGY